MKWKQGVQVKREKGYRLENAAGIQTVSPADEYIVNAIEKGTEDDEQLLELIMSMESADEIEARLRLAGFLLEYGEYIEELQGHQIIEG